MCFSIRLLRHHQCSTLAPKPSKEPHSILQLFRTYSPSCIPRRTPFVYAARRPKRTSFHPLTSANQRIAESAPLSIISAPCRRRPSARAPASMRRLIKRYTACDLRPGYLQYFQSDNQMQGRKKGSKKQDHDPGTPRTCIQYSIVQQRHSWGFGPAMVLQMEMEQ